MYIQDWFIYSSTVGHLGCFHLMNMCSCKNSVSTKYMYIHVHSSGVLNSQKVEITSSYFLCVGFIEPLDLWICNSCQMCNIWKLFFSLALPPPPSRNLVTCLFGCSMLPYNSLILFFFLLLFPPLCFILDNWYCCVFNFPNLFSYFV